MEIPVAWGDMDAFQHVNNVTYFRYFESIRIFYHEKTGWFQLREEIGNGPILGTTSCRFQFPVTYPDNILAGARTTEIKEKRFTMEYLLVSKQHSTVVAEGNAIVISYDYNNNCSVPIPENIVKAVKEMETTVS